MDNKYWTIQISIRPLMFFLFQDNFDFYRIHFDDAIKSKLPLTLADMRKVLFEVPSSRNDVPKSTRDKGWIMDFKPNSIANIALRKTDMSSFAVGNEGNHFNNLFYKV